MSAHLPNLFPIPSSPPSTLCPTVWPGVNPKSTSALREALQDNYKRWHIFFDNEGKHNHAAHHVVALWALGASETVLKCAYESNCSYQRPAFKSPQPITSLNFVDHLGDENYYNAYLFFFTRVLSEKSVSETLEEYIFSVKANFDPARDGAEKKQPEMLNRFLDSVLHPLIHVGYGAEFGIPGMIIEGLAQAAVHQASSTVMLPATFFKSYATTGMDQAVSRVASLIALDKTGTSSKYPRAGTHAFSILARILKDDKFTDSKSGDHVTMYEDTMQKHGETLKKHAEEWTVDTSDPKEVERKIEELIWANAIIYGIGGWSESEGLRADFFLMHFVTSSIFLPSVVAYLSPSSQVLLLRSYFVVCLAWWVARGRPGFDIPGFFASDSAHPISPGPMPSPLEGILVSTSSPDAITPNPWLPIIQSSIVHPDEHLPKIQRALAHFSTLYGSRIAGMPDFSGTELEGADKLDGTLFIRISGMTAKRLGRMREGERPGRFQEGVKPVVAAYWDREGFYMK